MTLGGTVPGPVVAVRVALLLGHHGIEVVISSISKLFRSSWVVISGGRHRFVHELYTLRSTYFHTSSELLAAQAIAKESEPCSTILEESHKEETRSKPAGPFDTTYFTKVEMPMKERKWTELTGRNLSTDTSKVVMRLVRHTDQDEQESNGEVH